MKDLLPDVITSDLFEVPSVDRVVDAMHMPFDDQTLKAILMTNVFHHIPDVARFISEASRTLRPGGRITGELALPGSKSIAQRALVTAALASGTTRIAGLPEGAAR